MFPLSYFLSTGTPCLCVDSNAGQEDEKGLLDTEDSRHRTCTRIPAVNFGTFLGKFILCYTSLELAKKKKEKKKLLIPFQIFSSTKHKCLYHFIKP